MGLRDKIKDQQYFDKFQKECLELIEGTKLSIINGEVPPDNVLNCKHMIFSDRLERLVSLYSSGSDMVILEQEFKTCLELMKDGWHDSVVKFHHRRPPVYLDQYWYSDYIYMIWMLSFGILLDVPDQDFDQLIQYLDRGKINDCLFNFLVNYRRTRDFEACEKLKYKPYSNLYKVIYEEDIANAEKNLLSYLKSWYKGSRNAYWHDNHLNDRNNLYFGYWSFESAAIVKILGLNKEKFKSCEYFPIDLLS